MTKKQLWNRLRKHRRRFKEARAAMHLAMYFETQQMLLFYSLQRCIRSPGFTDKGYLKRRVDQPLEYLNLGFSPESAWR